MRCFEMYLKDILSDLRSDDEIYDLLKDSSLISAVAFYNEKEELDRWELIFFDKKKDKAYKIDVSPEGEYEIYESELLDDKFKNVHVDVESLRVNEEEAMRIAHRHFMESYYNKKINGLFLVLDVINHTWNINMLSSFYSIIQISIDFISGEVVSSREVELIHEG